MYSYVWFSFFRLHMCTAVDTICHIHSRSRHLFNFWPHVWPRQTTTVRSPHRRRHRIASPDALWWSRVARTMGTQLQSCKQVWMSIAYHIQLRTLFWWAHVCRINVCTYVGCDRRRHSPMASNYVVPIILLKEIPWAINHWADIDMFDVTDWVRFWVVLDPCNSLN